MNFQKFVQKYLKMCGPPKFENVWTIQISKVHFCADPHLPNRKPPNGKLLLYNTFIRGLLLGLEFQIKENTVTIMVIQRLALLLTLLLLLTIQAPAIIAKIWSRLIIDTADSGKFVTHQQCN